MDLLMLQADGYPTSLEEAINQYGPILIEKVTTFLLFLAVYIAIYYVTKRLFKRGVRRALELRDINESVISLSVSTAEAFALILSLIAAATVAGFGEVMTAFATLSGAIVLAAGFAAQDLFSNFVAGVLILRDEPFHVGDWIEWEDGEGIVREIKLRISRVETFDNEVITVPNTSLAKNAVTNHTMNETLRISYEFDIGYEDDIGLAKEIILAEAGNVEGILENPEPAVWLTGLEDSAVGLRGMAWIENPSHALYVRHKATFVENVKHRFDEEGIDMPYPYRELTGDIGVADISDTGESFKGAEKHDPPVSQ